MARMPSNPKRPPSSAAENSSDGMPSGRGPSCSAALTTWIQCRTDSGSPERAASHAALCAANGWAAIRSPPSACIQGRPDVRLGPGQLTSKRLREEMVIAVPVPIVIKRYEDEVRPLEDVD